MIPFIRVQSCKMNIAPACDIQEMYLRVGLTTNGRKYHRFLWMDFDQTRTPDIYEFNRIVFGVNSSPFLAQFVLQEHAKRYKKLYPLAAETILKSTYMDSSMDSVKDLLTGIKLYEELSSLWKLAAIHARKWISNSPEVLTMIPVDDRASEIDLSRDKLPVVKTLGLIWMAHEDVFTYRSLPINNEFSFTKRNLLRKIASLFDLLGLLSPYTTEAKLLMQDVWLSGVSWGDELSEESIIRAKCWFAELEELPNIKIARCLKYKNDVDDFSIHVFTDSSEKAYGAVAYSRCVYPIGEIVTNLIAAMSRVAPLKTISVPRLELCRAMLGLSIARSITGVRKVLLEDVTFWVDSMNVLC